MGEHVDPGIESAVEGRGRDRMRDGQQSPLVGAVDQRRQRRNVEGGDLRRLRILDDDLDEVGTASDSPVEEPLGVVGTGDPGLGGESHHLDLRAPRRRGGRSGTDDRRQPIVGAQLIDE